MSRVRSHVRTAATSVLAAVALVATVLLMPASTASAGDGEAGLAGAVSERTARANVALATAQAVLRGEDVGMDATLALRDLWVAKDDLSPSDQAVAARLASRPVKTSTPIDRGNVRIHYNAAELTGGFTAEQVADQAAFVSQLYSKAGYRQPKPDFGKGGSNQTDIYIDQLPGGLYGYCTVDNDVQQPGPGRFDVPAFCVIDNDYLGFPRNTPFQNMQVTLAHEYFHAVQFAYDILDDGWFLEATATWAEDEVFDDINDNVQYLPVGAIGKPKFPMVRFGQLEHYGQWIFFRYLTEKFKGEKGAMPKLVLDMWKAADSSKGARKNRYSTQAIAQVLAKRKFNVDKAVSLFHDANRRSRAVYDEGAANAYPVKKLAGQKQLKKRGASKRFNAKLKPWSSQTYRYLPKKIGKGLKLRVSIAGPAKVRGTRAVVTQWKRNGKAKQKFVKINGRGRAQVSMPFASKSIGAIEVTLVNASTRYGRCYADPNSPWPCSGKPVDGKIKVSVLGTVVRK